jgi:hypothetical protein
MATLPAGNCTNDDEQASCRASPVTVMGTLKKPIALKPETYSLLPPHMDAAGCTAKSETPTWQIRRFEFNDSRTQDWTPQDPPIEDPNDLYPNGVAITPFRMMEVEIENVANGYKTSCTFNNQHAGFVENTWMACNRPEDHDRRNRYSVDTYLYFSAADGQLMVNQTWFCSDENVQSP